MITFLFYFDKRVSNLFIVGQPQ